MPDRLCAVGRNITSEKVGWTKDNPCERIGKNVLFVDMEAAMYFCDEHIAVLDERLGEDMSKFTV